MSENDRLTYIGPLESCKLTVTEELQAQYLEALEDRHLRYVISRGASPPVVHPGILLNFSNATRSPSFKGPNLQWVHARDQTTFSSYAYLGEQLTINWRADGHEERFGRVITQVSAVVTGPNGREIVKRISRGLNIYSREVRVWRTEPRDRFGPIAAHWQQPLALDPIGWPIMGKSKLATCERINLFSDRRANIHNDAEVAKSAGFAAPIVSAAQGMGYICEFMVDNFGERWLEHGSFTLAFHRPIYPGDQISIFGVVKELQRTNGVACAIKVQLFNQDKSLVTSGLANGQWIWRDP